MIEMVGPVITRALRASSTVGSIRRADAQSQVHQKPRRTL
jgi:hypothetical protein